MPKSAKLSPESPLENRTLTPVVSARRNVLSNAALVAASTSRSPRVSPHESLTTDAPLEIAVFTAARRLASKQSTAPTKTMCAPGAMVCEDSTSSACSAYQPLPPHTATLPTDDGLMLVNWVFGSAMDGSLRLKYCCASASSVGESYASTMAILTPCRCCRWRCCPKGRRLPRAEQACNRRCRTAAAP